jgi:hypothetical protein
LQIHGVLLAMAATSSRAAALVELLDECPEARELLRERTFARVFH